MGATRVDHLLMVLGVCNKMSSDEREFVTRQMMRGFNDVAKQAGTDITGGQSVMNPWPIIGGVANVVLHESQFIRPVNGKPGGVIVLSKPLGTQVAVNVAQWKRKCSYLQKQEEDKMADCKEHERMQQIKKLFGDKTQQVLNSSYKMSWESMSTLNLEAAKLMHKYKCQGATDVTGFGILGHAANLAKAQKQKVNIRIHSLPLIKGMKQVNDSVMNFKLMQGFSAETSGGLFMMIPSIQLATQLVEELRKVNGWGWIIGEIEKGDGDAYIDKENLKIIEV